MKIDFFQKIKDLKIPEKLKAAAQRVAAWAKAAGVKLKAFAAGFSAAAKSARLKLSTGVKSLWLKFSAAAKTFLLKFSCSVKSAVSKLVPGVKSALLKLVTLAKAAWSKCLSGLKTAAGKLLAFAKTSLGKISAGSGADRKKAEENTEENAELADEGTEKNTELADESTEENTGLSDGGAEKNTEIQPADARAAQAPAPYVKPEKKVPFVSGWSLPVRIITAVLVIGLVVNFVVPYLAQIDLSKSRFKTRTKDEAREIIAMYDSVLGSMWLQRRDSVARVFLSSYIGYITSASVYQEMEEYEKAALRLASAIELLSSDSASALANLYLQKGSLEILGGNYEAAAESLSLCIEKAPSASEAYYRRAQLYMVTGKLEAAVADVDRYEELEGETPETEAFFAELFEASGDYERAEKGYTVTLENQELYDKELLVNRARCRINLGNTQGAKDDLERYLSEEGKDEDHIASAMLCAIYLDAQDYDSALEVYEKAETGGYKATADLKNWIATAYMGTGQYEKALELYSQVLEENPEYTGASYCKGLCAYSLGLYEEAADAFTASINQGTELQFCYYYRAVCNINLERTRTIISDLKMVVKLGGDQELTDSAKEMLKLLQG